MGYESEQGPECFCWNINAMNNEGSDFFLNSQIQTVQMITVLQS